jgi:hypothetical protein
MLHTSFEKVLLKGAMDVSKTELKILMTTTITDVRRKRVVESNSCYQWMILFTFLYNLSKGQSV